MTIKNKLNIALSISVVMTMAAGVFGITRIETLDKEITENRMAGRIVQSVFELSHLTHDYLLHQEDRAVQQWRSKSRILSSELAGHSATGDRNAEKKYTDIISDLKLLEQDFLKLVELKTNNANNREEIAERKEIRSLITSQSMISNASYLLEDSRARLIKTQRQGSAFFAIAILALAFMVILIVVMFSQLVLKPFVILKEGAEKLGSGDLDHKIKAGNHNEIGILANAFNDMGSKLKKAYHGLEEKVRERTAELEAEKNKSEALLASIGDGVLAIDREQNIVYINNRAQELSKYEASEVVGKPYYDFLKFVREGDEREHLDFIRTALKGKVTKMAERTELIQKDGG